MYVSLRGWSDIQFDPYAGRRFTKRVLCNVENLSICYVRVDLMEFEMVSARWGSTLVNLFLT